MGDNSEQSDDIDFLKITEDKLKVISAKQIEQSIAKALSDLVGCPYTCKIESIQFGDPCVHPTKISLSTQEKHDYTNLNIRL